MLDLTCDVAYNNVGSWGLLIPDIIYTILGFVAFFIPQKELHFEQVEVEYQKKLRDRMIKKLKFCILICAISRISNTTLSLFFQLFQ